MPGIRSDFELDISSALEQVQALKDAVSGAFDDAAKTLASSLTAAVNDVSSSISALSVPIAVDPAEIATVLSSIADLADKVPTIDVLVQPDLTGLAAEIAAARDAEALTPAVLPVEADTSGIATEVQAAVDAVDAPPVPVSADTTPAKTEIDGLADNLTPVEVPVEADTSAASDAINALDDDITPIVVPVTADTAGLTDAVDTAVTDITNREAQITVSADAATIPAEIDAAVAATPIPDVEVPVTLDTSNIGTVDIPPTDVAVSADTTQAEADIAKLGDVEVQVTADITDLVDTVDTARNKIESNPIVVTVDADASAAPDEILSVLNAVQVAPFVVPVDGDTTQFVSALDQARSGDATLPIVIPVSADVTDFLATINDARDTISAPLEITITANADAVTSTLDTATRDAEQPIVVPIEGDSAPFVEALDSIHSEGPDPVIVLVEADTSDLVDEIQSAVSDVQVEPITITASVDTGEADGSLGDLNQAMGVTEESSKSLGDSLSTLSSVTQGVTSVTSLAEGELSGLGEAATVASESLGPEVAAVAALGASFGVLFSAGEQNVAAAERLDLVYGKFAETVKHINVGGLNGNLDELATKAGSSAPALEQSVAKLGALAEQAGRTAPQAGHVADQIAAIALSAVAANPSLGEAAAVYDKVSVAIGRGGLSLQRYGITLTQQEIIQRALNDTLKATPAQLTQVDKTIAGTELAVEKAGGKIGSAFDAGVKQAAVQLKSLKAEIEDSLGKAGEPLVKPTLEVLKSMVPIAKVLAQELGVFFRVLLPGMQVLGSIITAVESAFNSLDRTARGSGDALKTAFAPVTAVVDEIRTAVSAVGSGIAAAFSLVATPIRAVIEPLKEVAIRLGEIAAAPIVLPLVGLYRALAAAVHSVGDAASPVADAFRSLGAIVAGAVQPIKDAFAAAFGKAEDLLTPVVDAIRSVLIPAFHAAEAAVRPLITAIKTVAEVVAVIAVGPVIALAVGAFKAGEAAVNAFGAAIHAVVGVLAGPISDAIGVVRDAFDSVSSTVADVAHTIGSVFKQAGLAAFAAVGEAVVTVFHSIEDAVRSFAHVVEAAPAAAFHLFVTSITTGINALRSAFGFFETIRSTILGAFGDAFGKVIGVVEGFVSNVRHAGDEISPIFHRIDDAVSGLVDVFKGPFELIVAAFQSFVHALQSGAAPVSGVFDSIKSAVGSLADVFESILAPVGHLVTSVFHQIADAAHAIEGPISKVVDIVKSAIGPIKGILDSVGDTVSGVVSGIGDKVGGIFGGGGGGHKATDDAKAITAATKEMGDALFGSVTDATTLGEAISGLSSNLSTFVQNDISDATGKLKKGFDDAKVSAAALTDAIQHGPAAANAFADALEKANPDNKNVKEAAAEVRSLSAAYQESAVEALRSAVDQGILTQKQSDAIQVDAKRKDGTLDVTKAMQEATVATEKYALTTGQDLALAVEKARNAEVAKQQQEFVSIATTGHLTDAQIDLIEKTHTLTNGTIDYVAAAVDAQVTSDQIAKTQNDLALKTTLASGAFSDLGTQLIAGTISAAAGTLEFRRMGFTADEAKTFVDQLSGSFQKLLDAASQALPQLTQLFQTFEQGISSASSKLNDAIIKDTPLQNARIAVQQAGVDLAKAEQVSGSGRAAAILLATRESQEAYVKLVEAQKHASKDVKDAQAQLDDAARPDHFIANLQDSIAQIANFQKNIDILIARGHTTLAAELIKQGAAGAGAAASFAADEAGAKTGEAVAKQFESTKQSVLTEWSKLPPAMKALLAGTKFTLPDGSVHVFPPGQSPSEQIAGEVPKVTAATAAVDAIIHRPAETDKIGLLKEVSSIDYVLKHFHLDPATTRNLIQVRDGAIGNLQPDPHHLPSASLKDELSNIDHLLAQPLTPVARQRLLDKKQAVTEAFNFEKLQEKLHTQLDDVNRQLSQPTSPGAHAFLEAVKKDLELQIDKPPSAAAQTVIDDYNQVLAGAKLTPGAETAINNLTGAGSGKSWWDRLLPKAPTSDPGAAGKTAGQAAQDGFVGAYKPAEAAATATAAAATAITGQSDAVGAAANTAGAVAGSLFVDGFSKSVAFFLPVALTDVGSSVDRSGAGLGDIAHRVGGGAGAKLATGFGDGVKAHLPAAVDSTASSIYDATTTLTTAAQLTGRAVGDLFADGFGKGAVAAFPAQVDLLGGTVSDSQHGLGAVGHRVGGAAGAQFSDGFGAGAVAHLPHALDVAANSILDASGPLGTDSNLTGLVAGDQFAFGFGTGAAAFLPAAFAAVGTAITDGAAGAADVAHLAGVAAGGQFSSGFGEGATAALPEAFAHISAAIAREGRGTRSIARVQGDGAAAAFGFGLTDGFKGAVGNAWSGLVADIAGKGIASRNAGRVQGLLTAGGFGAGLSFGLGSAITNSFKGAPQEIGASAKGAIAAARAGGVATASAFGTGFMTTIGPVVAVASAVAAAAIASDTSLLTAAGRTAGINAAQSVAAGMTFGFASSIPRAFSAANSGIIAAGPSLQRSGRAIGVTVGNAVGAGIASSLGGAVSGAVAGGSSGLGEAHTIGLNIDFGIIRGLEDGAGAVAAVAAGVVHHALDAMNTAAKTNSPSLVTKETGKGLAEGLAVGIQDPAEVTRAVGAAQSTVRAVIDAVVHQVGGGAATQALGKQVSEGLTAGLSGSNAVTATRLGDLIGEAGTSASSRFADSLHLTTTLSRELSAMNDALTSADHRLHVTGGVDAIVEAKRQVLVAYTDLVEAHNKGGVDQAAAVTDAAHGLTDALHRYQQVEASISTARGGVEGAYRQLVAAHAKGGADQAAAIATAQAALVAATHRFAQQQHDEASQLALSAQGGTVDATVQQAQRSASLISSTIRTALQHELRGAGAADLGAEVQAAVFQGLGGSGAAADNAATLAALNLVAKTHAGLRAAEAPLRAAGTNLAGAVAEGLSDTATAEQAASALGTALEKALNASLGIASPSTVGISVGKNLVAGLLAGLVGHDALLADAANELGGLLAGTAASASAKFASSLHLKSTLDTELKALTLSLAAVQSTLTPKGQTDAVAIAKRQVEVAYGELVKAHDKGGKDQAAAVLTATHNLDVATGHYNEVVFLINTAKAGVDNAYKALADAHKAGGALQIAAAETNLKVAQTRFAALQKDEVAALAFAANSGVLDKTIAQANAAAVAISTTIRTALAHELHGAGAIALGTEVQNGVFEGLGGAGSTVDNRAALAAASLADRAHKALQAAAKPLNDTGKNLAAAVAEGLSDVAAAEAAAKALGGKIEAALKASLGIHSPSTVGIAIGQDLAAGVAQGLSPNDPKFVATATAFGTQTAVLMIHALAQATAALADSTQAELVKAAQKLLAGVSGWSFALKAGVTEAVKHVDGQPISDALGKQIIRGLVKGLSPSATELHTAATELGGLIAGIGATASQKLAASLKLDNVFKVEFKAVTDSLKTVEKDLVPKGTIDGIKLAQAQVTEAYKQLAAAHTKGNDAQIEQINKAAIALKAAQAQYAEALKDHASPAVLLLDKLNVQHAYTELVKAHKDGGDAAVTAVTAAQSKLAHAQANFDSITKEINLAKAGVAQAYKELGELHKAGSNATAAQIDAATAKLKAADANLVKTQQHAFVELTLSANQGAVQGLVGNADNAALAIVKAIDAALKKEKDHAGAIALGKEVQNGVFEGLRGSGDTVDNVAALAARDLALKTHRALGKAQAEMRKGGSDLAAAVAAGLLDLHAAEAAAKALGGNVAAALREALGIKSPSTVGIEIGTQVTEGIAAGLAATSPALDAASQQVTGHIVSPLLGLADKAKASIGEFQAVGANLGTELMKALNGAVVPATLSTALSKTAAQASGPSAKLIDGFASGLSVAARTVGSSADLVVESSGRLLAGAAVGVSSVARIQGSATAANSATAALVDGAAEGLSAVKGIDDAASAVAAASQNVRGPLDALATQAKTASSAFKANLTFEGAFREQVGLVHDAVKSASTGFKTAGASLGDELMNGITTPFGSSALTTALSKTVMTANVPSGHLAVAPPATTSAPATVINPQINIPVTVQAGPNTTPQQAQDVGTQVGNAAADALLERNVIAAIRSGAT